MTRLIDADAFKTRLEHEAWSRGPIELLRARDISDETPTVDAVPVIRCRDCKHWSGDDDDTFCSELGIFGTDPNSFCSYAKRKAK